MPSRSGRAPRRNRAGTGAASPPAPERPASLEEARRLLAECQARAAELYHQVPIAYVTIDGGGMTVDINAPGAALLGVERRYAIGLPFRVFVASADRPQLTEHLRRFRREGEAVSELELNTRHGGRLAAQLQSRTTIDGQDLCFTAILDVTVQRRAEEERRRLEAAERIAREANAAKDVFIATLSHELRAPLAPVLAAASSLRAGALGEDAGGRLLAIIQRNVLAEARLIDDLLDVARITTGKISLERGVVDVHEVLSEALEPFASELGAAGLTTKMELGAEQHHLDADPLRLRQVLVNLIKNAVRHTPEGGEIGLRSWNRDDRLLVEVSDTGEGIAAGDLSRIFNRFEQAHPQSTSRGGLGLGLAISKGIIELHGGQITAYSPGHGKGARFLVELGPTIAAPAFLASSVVEVGEVGEVGEEERRPARRSPHPVPAGKVLLVEDEADLSETLAMVLKSEGYDVETAASARAALAVDLEKVSVVVSDIGLPDLDGRQLLGQIRARCGARAIALSGFGTEADVRASLEAGFVQHLTKPIEMETLLGAVQSAAQAFAGDRRRERTPGHRPHASRST